MQSFDLIQLGISGPQVLRDLSPAILYEESIRFDHKTSNSASGALVAYSGSYSFGRAEPLWQAF